MYDNFGEPRECEFRWAKIYMFHYISLNSIYKKEKTTLVSLFFSKILFLSIGASKELGVCTDGNGLVEITVHRFKSW